MSPECKRKPDWDVNGLAFVQRRRLGRMWTLGVVIVGPGAAGLLTGGQDDDAEKWARGHLAGTSGPGSRGRSKPKVRAAGRDWPGLPQGLQPSVLPFRAAGCDPPT